MNDESLWIIGGTIAAGLAAGLLLAPLIWRWSLARRPFELEYSYRVGVREGYTDEDIILGKALEGVNEWHSTKDKLLLSSTTPYTIYLDLKPRKSSDIDSIGLRFIEEGENQPLVLLLQDISPQSQEIQKPSAVAAGGISLYYRPGLHTHRGGRTVNYLATFQTHGPWQGKLSVRLGIVGQSVCFIRIPCQVTEG